MRIALIFRSMALCFLLAFTLCYNINYVFANGGPYAPSALGGIEFQYNVDISIESEVLHVTSRKIHVSYIFKSTSKESQIVEIAFPIATDDAELGGSRPEGNVDPKLEVYVNGKKVEAKRRIFTENIDISDMFKRNAEGELTYYMKDDEATKSFFKQHNLEFSCDIDDRGCLLLDFIDEIYVWQQNFEPGITTVDVKYVPHVGGDYYFDKDVNIDKQMRHDFGFFQSDLRVLSPTFRQYFCIDTATEAAMKRLGQKSETDSGFSVIYIWDTARYWQGPIKNFHLIIDKDSANQIISYCPYVGEKTSPTRFEWKAKNFVPQGTLRVFFYPTHDLTIDN